MTRFVQRRGLIVSVALILAFAFGAVLFGSSSHQVYAQDQDVSFSVEGKISELSSGKITVDSGGNMNFEVRYDSKTEIQHKDGTPANISEFRVGMEIRAEGVLTESGDVIAKKIVLESGSKGSSG